MTGEIPELRSKPGEFAKEAHGREWRAGHGQSDPRPPRTTSGNLTSPRDLAEALLEMNPVTLDYMLGPATAMRFRHGHETVCDLIVGAVRMGVNPARLFDSFDVP